MSQKSYERTNILYLVPTPLGNMQDISERAIEVLGQSDAIFCEDTRVTNILLKSLGIKVKLFSCNEQNEAKVKELILDYLNNDSVVSLVSDRGTPLISDPGYKVVQHIIENDHNVVALPGPTAFVPALIASGLKTAPFTFYGFLNAKKTKRKAELELLAKDPYTLIFYEAPHRILEMLDDIKTVLGDRKISISREISKIHEEIYRGTASEVIKELSVQEIRGEFVVVVSGNEELTSYDKISIAEHVKMYVDEGFDEKVSLKKVAKDRNSSKSEIYKIYHKGKWLYETSRRTR